MSENQEPKEVMEEVEVKEEKALVGPVEMAPVEEPKTYDKGALVNALDIQSVDIPDKFTVAKKANGWFATINADKSKVTINMKSMRRLEYTLRSGDTIEKDGDTIIILQTEPEEDEEITPRVSRSLSYRSRRRAVEEGEATSESSGTNTSRSRRRDAEAAQNTTE